MKKILFILLFFIFSGKLFSQGFDWQYSSRLPFTHPKFFLGGFASVGVIANSGKFSFLEDFIPCCDYEAGDGKVYKTGMLVEFWESGNLALNGAISLSYNSSRFTTIIEVPRSDGIQDYLSKYQYILDESRSYLGAEFGAKYRLYETHFSVGGSLGFDYKIYSSANHRERIIAPSTETFIDGSTERVITNGIIGKYYGLMVTPQIYANYDVSLGIGYYSSVKLFATLPLMSVVQDENWQEWKLGLSFQILKSYK